MIADDHPTRDVEKEKRPWWKSILTVLATLLATAALFFALVYALFFVDVLLDDYPNMRTLVLVSCVLLAATPILLLVLAPLLSIPISARMKRRMERQEKTLKNQLKDVGRFMDWSDVESKLERGEGTLIVESCFPKGPVREWWTEDDVIGNAPRALSDSTDADLDRRTDRLADYARSCVVRYVNLDSGVASITEPPEGLLWDWDRKLDEKYPRGRIVTLENMGAWRIAEGDMKFREEPEQ